MNTLTSKDRATIAFDEQGRGPALILVDGAMGTRSAGSKPELARLLAQRFTVYSYVAPDPRLRPYGHQGQGRLDPR